MAEEIIYTMKGVGKVYPPNRYVLKNIYLSYFYGAKIGVLGLNGSGKSTLLKSIYGMLSGSSFKKGKVTFAGKSIVSTPSYSLIKEGLVYVPQKNNTFDKVRNLCYDIKRTTTIILLFMV